MTYPGQGASEATGRLSQWRHALHAAPETGFNESWTSDYLAEQLAAMGLPVERGIGGTGLVATLTGGDSPRSIGLRADMDALALLERAEKSYRSRNDGVMHACGHDGHMAMLLGAAARLVGERDVNGTVRFIFQPAEEHGRGAKAMIADGLFERFPVDAIYGLHNMPGIPAGHLETRPGAIMASEDNFEIVITGRGGHAARPHMVVDPIVVAAEIVMALQTVVSRNVDPNLPAVVSCTEVITDGVRNAIPGQVIIRGDTRSYSPDVQSLLERRMRAICVGICAAHGATCEFTYSHEFEPTVNDPRCTTAVVAAALRSLPQAQVNGEAAAVMASEDFGAFLRIVPGCFAFLGNGTEDGYGAAPLHSPDYDFNDAILHVGVQFYVDLVHEELG